MRTLIENRRAGFRAATGWVVLAVGLWAATMPLPRATHATGLFLAAALAWGCYLLAALAGWGTLVARALLPPHSVGWALRAALGLAASVAAGGVLNLAGVISRPLLLALLAAGVALAARTARREWPAISLTVGEAAQALRRDWALTALVGAAVTVAAIELAGSAFGAINNVSLYRDFDVHDDYQAYLVFPEAMLQHGSIPPQPFDARRMISLGGQSFLHTLVLVMLPLRALHSLDGGVAFAIFLAVLAGLLADRRVHPRIAALVVLFVLALPHLDARGNTSGLWTGAALLLALFALADSGLLETGGAWQRGATMALLASAMTAIKLTFLPAVALFLAVSWLFGLQRRDGRGNIVREAGTTALLALAFLAPWMIALHQSSGTFLYPLLGAGNYGSVSTGNFAAVTGEFAISIGERADIVLNHVLRVWPVLLLGLLATDRNRRRPALALALATALSIAVLVLLGDPWLDRSLSRYAFPIASTALAALLAASLSAVAERAHLRIALAGAVAVAAFARGEAMARSSLVQSVANLAGTVSGAALDYPAERHETRTLQDAVPPGELILARVPFPFAFDFRRNPILIDSLPGMASPPPGMPTFAGGEAVARFLGDHGIRYLAYGSRNDPVRLLNLSEKDINDRYPRSRVRWVMLRYHQDFEGSVEELAARRRHAADTTQAFVLDLATREVRPAGAFGGLACQGVRDDGWTSGAARCAGLGWELEGGSVLGVELAGWHPLRADPARLALRVLADGIDLPLTRTIGNVALFALPREVRRINEIEVRSATFDATAFDAPLETPLGLDLVAIRAGSDVAAVAAPAAGRGLDLTGELRPEAIPDRQGFFSDNNWTSGDATLAGFRLPVPAGHRRLVLEVGPAHAFRSDTARLAVRVFANGVPLAPEGGAGGILVFRLYRSASVIERLRIVSSTYVPRELGIGSDARRLGVPVVAISTRP